MSKSYPVNWVRVAARPHITEIKSFFLFIFFYKDTAPPVVMSRNTSSCQVTTHDIFITISGPQSDGMQLLRVFSKWCRISVQMQIICQQKLRRKLLPGSPKLSPCSAVLMLPRCWVTRVKYFWRTFQVRYFLFLTWSFFNDQCWQQVPCSRTGTELLCSSAVSPSVGIVLGLCGVRSCCRNVLSCERLTRHVFNSWQDEHPDNLPDKLMLFAQNKFLLYLQ